MRNVKVNLEEIEWGSVDGIYLGEEKIAYAQTVTSLRVALNARNLSGCKGANSLSKMNVIHGYG